MGHPQPGGTGDLDGASVGQLRVAKEDIVAQQLERARVRKLPLLNESASHFARGGFIDFGALADFCRRILPTFSECFWGTCAASYRICRGVDAVSRNTVSYGLLSNLPVQDSEERQLPVLSPRLHAVERDGYCFFTASPQTLRFRCYDRRYDRRQSKINRHDKSAY